MEQRNYMRKKNQKLTRVKNSNDGFNGLIDAHTQALENNSLKISEALEALADKPLTLKQKDELKRLKSALKRIDKGIDKL